VFQYLTLEDALEQVEFLGLRVRDQGLLHAAVERPRSSAFGADAYSDIETKAAAMLHSLLKNHALYEGNKRLGWLLFTSFLVINGYRHSFTDAAGLQLVNGLITDDLDIATAAQLISEHLILVGDPD
jgi:death on curing protein